MIGNKIITREEALGGFLGKGVQRARSVLHLIEAETSRLVKGSQYALVPQFNGALWGDRNAAYLSAVASSARSDETPSIQSLERHAPDWAALVPDNPEARAATAKKLSEKYRLSKAKLPQLRQALGLDDAVVADAFQRLFKAPLDSLYSTKTSIVEDLRWGWARLSTALEAMPPFWSAFALMIAGTIGPSILALPIAFAGVGPLAGAAIVFLVGVFNILTVAYLAEACARNSAVLYGSAFIGRVTRDFLGGGATRVLRIALFGYCCFVLFAFYNGFGSALADITGIEALLWIAGLFLVSCYIITRNSLTMTVAAALLIGFANIIIILLLTLVAFNAIGWPHFVSAVTRFNSDALFELSILQLVFGVTFYAFCGHISVSNCAQVVLRRDPSGKNLIGGATAGVAAVMVIYCLWVLAVNGNLDPEVLQSERGTALAPLAAKIGPSIHVLGAAFVVLALGIGSIQYALGIVNMTREFDSERKSKDQGAGKAGFEVLSDRDFVPQLSEITELPPSQRRLLVAIMRAEATGENLDLSAGTGDKIGHDQKDQATALAALRKRGLIECEGRREGPVYRIKADLRGWHPGYLPALSESLKNGSKSSPRNLWADTPNKSWWLSLRDWLPLMPVALVFLSAEILIFLDLHSFAKPLNWIGGLLPPLIGGVFPALLLVASRRKGRSIVSKVPAILTTPSAVTLIIALSLGSYLLHGLLIWQDLLARLTALGVCLCILALLLTLVRHGAFKPALLIEINQSLAGPEPTQFRIDCRGEPIVIQHRLTFVDRVEDRLSASGEIGDLDQLMMWEFELPRLAVQSLRIAAHGLDGDGNPLGLSCRIRIADTQGWRTVHFDKTGSALSVPLETDATSVRLQFQPKNAPPKEPRF